MNPIFKWRKKRKVGKLPFLSSWFDLFFILSINIEHSPWYNLATKADPHYHTFQEVTFFSAKVRICTDCFIKISCKSVFYFSGSINLIRVDYWKLFPVSIEKISCYPVCHFIDSCSFWFYFRRQLSLFTPFSCHLDNKVIFFFTQDASPKLYLFGLLCNAKSF